MILLQADADYADHAGCFRISVSDLRLTRNIVKFQPLSVFSFHDSLGTENLSAGFFILQALQRVLKHFLCKLM